jgi:hypothetical protein
MEKSKTDTLKFTQFPDHDDELSDKRFDDDQFNIQWKIIEQSTTPNTPIDQPITQTTDATSPMSQRLLDSHNKTLAIQLSHHKTQLNKDPLTSPPGQKSIICRQCYGNNTSNSSIRFVHVVYNPSTTVTNTSAIGSASNVSVVTPVSGSNYIYIDSTNDPRFPFDVSNGTTQVGYSGIKIYETTTIYIKFTTHATINSGVLFHTNEFSSTEGRPRFEHYYDGSGNMYINVDQFDVII